MVGGGKGRGVFRGEKTVVEGGGEGGAGVDEVVIDGREEMGGDGGCGEGEEDEERERVEDFHGWVCDCVVEDGDEREEDEEEKTEVA